MDAVADARRVRLAKGYTLLDVACELDVDKSYYAKIELKLINDPHRLIAKALNWLNHVPPKAKLNEKPPERECLRCEETFQPLARGVATCEPCRAINNEVFMWNER